MRNRILIFISVLVLVGCHDKRSIQSENPEQSHKRALKSKFEQVSSKEILGSELYKIYDSKNQDAPFGDFMSRIWENYGENLESVGKPKNIKGSTYAFKHKKTGIIFSAYPGGFGPSFGGFHKDKDKLKTVILEFEKLLELSTNADCEFVLLVDIGRFKIGAKSGKPFETIISFIQ